MNLGRIIKLSAASAFAGSLVYANLPTRYTIGDAEPTVKSLSEAKLQKTVPGATFQNEKCALSDKIIKVCIQKSAQT